jgi:indole-3-glycerol phosphate synthase
MVPPHKLCVSESGIFTRDDIKQLQTHNIHNFLIGESLMRHDDVALATQNLLM